MIYLLFPIAHFGARKLTRYPLGNPVIEDEIRRSIYNEANRNYVSKKACSSELLSLSCSWIMLHIATRKLFRCKCFRHTGHFDEDAEGHNSIIAHSKWATWPILTTYSYSRVFGFNKTTARTTWNARDMGFTCFLEGRAANATNGAKVCTFWKISVRKSRHNPWSKKDWVRIAITLRQLTWVWILYVRVSSWIYIHPALRNRYVKAVVTVQERWWPAVNDHIKSIIEDPTECPRFIFSPDLREGL